MDCMHALNPKWLVEEKSISFGEVLVNEHINREMDDLDKVMQTKEETNITSISEASKYDDEKNISIDKNDIHYEGKKDEYVNQYTNGDKDDNGRYIF